MPRRLWRFDGRVQGVGFRATTVRLASRYAVSGYVRNLPDGGVEVLAEGTEIELDTFRRAILQAMRSYIDEVTEHDASAHPRTPQGFIIRY
jgi:acylphosphatase